MHALFSAPTSGKGFLGYAALGFSGAVVALLVGALFPSLIPARATTVKL
jgi:hypothetical protein